LPALIGGGAKAKPGEVSLAHHGVLFLDELPEFARATLETLRQPLESGRVMVARASAHLTYPARFQLVAAMNPCRCGYLDDADRSCNRAPRCAQDYQSRISGPLLDRIDLNVHVSAVTPHDLTFAPPGENSQAVGARVMAARDIQRKRFEAMDLKVPISLNAHVTGNALEEVATPDAEGQTYLLKAAERFKLTGRGYHRILRVARTIADLDRSDQVRGRHVAEAIAFRQLSGGS
jgi:magnesium chelatase family protein